VKAILTKYHGPTDSRGSRISATDMDGHKVTVPYDHSLSSEENHDKAALRFHQQMGWTGHNLMRGSLPKGNVYTFEAACNRLSVKGAEVTK